MTASRARPRGFGLVGVALLPQGDCCLLVRGEGEVLVDAAIVDRLPALQWRIWNASKPGGKRYKYVAAPRKDRSIVLLHRVVAGACGELMVDHINGSGLDNRQSNLRTVNRSVNAQNQHGPMVTNQSGYLGVRFDRRGRARPWRAEITVDKRKVHLGVYTTPEEAYRAYLAAKAKYHPGSFLGEQGKAAP